MAKFYVCRNGKTSGPYTSEEIRKRDARNRLRDDDQLSIYKNGPWINYSASMPYFYHEEESPAESPRYAIRERWLGKPTVKFRCLTCNASLSDSVMNGGNKDACPNCNTTFITPGIEERTLIEKEMQLVKRFKDERKQERESRKGTQQLPNEQQDGELGQEMPAGTPSSTRAIFFGAFIFWVFVIGMIVRNDVQARSRQRPPMPQAELDEPDVNTIPMPSQPQLDLDAPEEEATQMRAESQLDN